MVWLIKYWDNKTYYQGKFEKGPCCLPNMYPVPAPAAGNNRTAYAPKPIPRTTLTCIIFLCIIIQMIPVKMNDEMYDIYVYFFLHRISINHIHCHCHCFLYERAFTTCYKSELKIRSSYCAPVPIWLWSTSGENSQNVFIDVLSSLACGLEEYSTVAVR